MRVEYLIIIAKHSLAVHLIRARLTNSQQQANLKYLILQTEVLLADPGSHSHTLSCDWRQIFKINVETKTRDRTGEKLCSNIFLTKIFSTQIYLTSYFRPGLDRNRFNQVRDLFSDSFAFRKENVK